MAATEAAMRRAALRREARGDLRRVRRPIAAGAFELTYLRTGPGEGPPVFVLPGGPGVASVLPYEGFRKLAAARGLDVLMMEHRGVGFSRRDVSGVDLPWSELSIAASADDMAAVLDDCGVRRAVIYGCSYGSYLAAAFGARHPDRVAGMLLDSPVLGAGAELIARANIRRLFWDGNGPASKLRALLGDGVVPEEQAGTVVQIAYEFGGPSVLDQLLDTVAAGRKRTWEWLAGLGAGELSKPLPYFSEFDLVGAIAYGELGYGVEPDGLPLDPGRPLAEAAKDFPPFTGEPFDLHAALRNFTWPTVALSGDRDLRTPRAVAEEVVALAQDAVLLPIRDLGHSTLDCHPLAALHAAHAVMAGTHHRLPQLAERIAALPRVGRQRMIAPLIKARLLQDRLLG